MEWPIYRKEDAESNYSYIQWFIEEASRTIDLELILPGRLNHRNRKLEKTDEIKEAAHY